MFWSSSGGMMCSSGASYSRREPSARSLSWQELAAEYNRRLPRKPRRDCPDCGAPWKETCDYCGREGIAG